MIRPAQRRPVPAGRMNDPTTPRNAPVAVADLTFEPVELNGGRFGVCVTPRARARGGIGVTPLRSFIVPVDPANPNAFVPMVDGFIDAAAEALKHAGFTPDDVTEDDDQGESSTPSAVCSGCGLRIYGDLIETGRCKACAA